MRRLLALMPLLSAVPVIGAAEPWPLRQLPPLPQPPTRELHLHRLPQRGTGSAVSINGLRQQARWRLEAGELWLPLEVLEGQLGMSRSQGDGGGLVLEWYGQRQELEPGRQRSLDDEVAVPALPLLNAMGVQLAVQGEELQLSLPPTALRGIRSRDLGVGARRVVLDLGGPGLVRSGNGRLLVSAESNPEQQRQLEALGLAPRQEGPWLSLRAEGQRLSLASPWRLVLDLAGSGAGAGDTAARPARDPRLAALLGQGLAIERSNIWSGSQQLLLHSVRLDPQRVPLELRPLNRPDGMQGLSSLRQLARQEQALIAINGGYFNRVNRLPLGGLRDEGRWLSGPILNRGAIGWDNSELPLFGRLSLEESVQDSQGRRWPLIGLNSGYVQKGLARYTADWGRSYQPISGGETAVLVHQGTVQRRFETADLDAGAPLAPGDELFVARGGLVLPWAAGERLQLRSRASHPLGSKPFVIAGGPLLLQNGQLVLNGVGEGFSSGFLAQGAPRTVIASDGRQLWLITLQGLNGPGPTLLETAQVLQRQGLREALNLDGGSSTGLVLGQEQTVMGRGVAAAVHNGLGLVPREELQGRDRPLTLGAVPPTP
jgi:Phosphodiester glycosidase